MASIRTVLSSGKKIGSNLLKKALGFGSKETIKPLQTQDSLDLTPLLESQKNLGKPEEGYPESISPSNSLLKRMINRFRSAKETVNNIEDITSQGGDISEIDNITTENQHFVQITSKLKNIKTNLIKQEKAFSNLHSVISNSKKVHQYTEISKEIDRMSVLNDKKNIFSSTLRKFIGQLSNLSSIATYNPNNQEEPSSLNIPNPLSLLGNTLRNFATKAFGLLKGMVSCLGKLLPWVGLGMGILALALNTEEIGRFLAEKSIDIVDNMKEKFLDFFGFEKEAALMKADNNIERKIRQGVEVTQEDRVEYAKAFDKVHPDEDFKIRGEGVKNKTNEFEFFSPSTWFSESKSFGRLSLKEVHDLDEEERENYNAWMEKIISQKSEYELLQKLIDGKPLSKQDITSGMKAIDAHTKRIIEILFNKNYIQVLEDSKKEGQDVEDHLKNIYKELIEKGEIKADERYINHQNTDAFREKFGLDYEGKKLYEKSTSSTKTSSQTFNAEDTKMVGASTISINNNELHEKEYKEFNKALAENQVKEIQKNHKELKPIVTNKVVHKETTNKTVNNSHVGRSPNIFDPFGSMAAGLV